ncbi:hypothetical protein DKT77_04820, partial [Meridianimarinicoccus roseus]
IGGLGDDEYVGGVGTDTAVIADGGGAAVTLGDFTVTGASVDGSGAFSGQIAGPDGTETLSGIEVIEVTNTGSSTFLVYDGMSIQAAIDAASHGDTILVGAGDYSAEGKILITDKALSISGALAGVSPTGDNWAGQAPGSETIIDGFTLTGTGGLSLDGVRLLGTGPESGNGLSGIQAYSSGDLSVVNSVIQVDGSAEAGLSFSPAGIDVSGTNGDITVDNVLFTAFKAPADPGASHTEFPYGIYLNYGDAVTARDVSVTSSKFDLGGSGGDFGFPTAIATDGRTGDEGSFVIQSNAFEDTAPRFAIGHFDFSGRLQDDGNNDQVTAGPVDFSGVSGNTFTDTLGSDANTGVIDNRSGFVIETGPNTIDGVAYDKVVADVTVAADTTISSTADDEFISGDDGLDVVTFTGNFADYTINVDASGAISITDTRSGAPDGSDTLIGIEALQFADGFGVVDGMSIQAAVDAASDGDTINVGAGTFREQVVIDGRNDLTIRGQGDATLIEMVDTPVLNHVSATDGGSRDRAAVVTVRDSGNITVADARIDGRGLGDAMPGGANPDFEGVLYFDASGAIDDLTVTGVRDTLQGDGTPKGNQRGNAIVVINDDGTARSVSITDNSTTDFQKNGITISGDALTVTVTGNMVTGSGFLPASNAIAQNGIQLSFGATGTIDGNTVSEIGYQRGDFITAHVLVFNAGDGAEVTNNTLNGTADASFSGGVVLFGGDNAVVTGNTIDSILFGVTVASNGAANTAETPTISGNVFTNPVTSILPLVGGSNPEVSAASAANGSNIGAFLSDNTLAVTLDGSTGADELFGTPQNDTLNGLDGNDIIGGDGGNDTLDMGAGNDDATGGTGDDTYVYTSGDDVITELPGEGADSITLPAGITQADLSFANSGADLVITVGSLGTITLVGQADRSDRVETLVLDGGATIAINEVPDAIDDNLDFGGGAAFSLEDSSQSINVNALRGNDVIYSTGVLSDLALVAVNGSTGPTTTAAGEFTFPTGQSDFTNGLRFIPVNDFFGEVSFTYTIEAPNGLQDTATVTFTVQNINDPPVAVPATAGVDENSSINLTDTLLAGFVSDVDNDFAAGVIDTLSITNITAPVAGSLTTDVSGDYVFDAAGAFEGLDDGESATETLTYTVDDGNGATATNTITITIDGVNDAPEVLDQSFTADENQTSVGTVAATDVDVETLTYSLASGGDNDLFSIDASTGELTFNTAPNFEDPQDAGGDNTYDLTVTVDDGDVTETAAITVAVADVNDAPVAADDTATTDEDNPVSGNVITGPGTDTDEDTLPSPDTLSVIYVDGSTVTSGGSVTVAGSNGGSFTVSSDGSYDFDPGGDFNDMAVGDADKTTSVEYTVSDGEGGTDTAILTVTVTAVNDTPTAGDDSGAGFGTDEDTAFTTGNVLDNDTDPDTNDTLSVSAFDTTGTQGTVTDNGNGTFGYDPNGQFESLGQGATATDTFSYTASDANGGTNTATVTIEITGVNDGPTAVADSDTTGEDGPALTGGNVLANDTDPDTGDTKTVIGVGAATGNVGTIVTGSNGGDFTIDANGDWSFDPAGAFEDLDDGEDRVTEVSYTMEDSQGATSTTTLSVTVNGANDPATGGTPSAAYTEDDTGRTIDLLAGSNDVDGDALTVNNVTVTAPDSRTVTFSVSPAGVLTLDDGQFEDLDEGDLFELTIDYNINDGT